MRNVIHILCLLALAFPHLGFSATPEPPVNIVGDTDGTRIGNSSDRLKVEATQSSTWTTGRTWTLLNSTDSVNSVQSGTWTTGRTWTLSNGTDSIAAVQSGTWTVRNQDGSGNSLASATSAPTGSEQALIVRNIPSGTQTVSGTVAVTQSTSPWVTSRNWTLGSGTDSISSVQSGTWTVQPGNTANTTPWLSTINQGGNSATVTGSNALKVDGSAVTQPISAAALPLPSGASTSALQTAGNASLTSIDAGIPAALGQTTMSAGMPVSLASDQSAIPVTQSGTWTAGRTWALSSGTDSIAAVQSGTWVVSLPTGASTSALQSETHGSVAPGTAATKSELVGGVYNSSAPTLTNGQQSSLQLTASGTLKTDAAITSTVGSYVDKGSFTYGTDKFNPTGGIYQDTSPSLTAGQVGVSRMTANRALHVNLRDASGTEFATANNPLIIAPANSLGSLTFGDITTSASTIAKVERTAYTEQTTNGQRSIKSASASDASAGTGARTIKITYFDQTGSGPFTETVTLNGTTCVATVSTTIAFVEKIEVLTIGSTGSNVGILTFSSTNACGGATIGTVAATDNQTFWAHHYVAINKVANITGISVSHNGTTVGSGGVFVLRAVAIPVANLVESQISDFVRLYGQASTFARNYASPIKVTGPARITAYVTPETASSTVYRGAIDFYEQ